MARKILVVEDHEIARKIAVLTLTQLHCDVDIAENGRRALALVQENRYDLIFMDIGLPDIDGITVAEAIKEMASTIGYIPIAALTAHSEKQIQEECMRAGIEAFLVKPLTAEAAAQILKTFVDEAKQLSEVC